VQRHRKAEMEEQPRIRSDTQTILHT